MRIKWLSSEENRETKQHASALVYLKTKEMLERATAFKLRIAGGLARAEKCVEPFRQCMNCQKFKHNEYQCKGKPKCKLRTGPHQTKAYICSECGETGKKYSYLIAKCVNCAENHCSDDEQCEIRKLQLQLQKSRPNPNPKADKKDFIMIDP